MLHRRAAMAQGIIDAFLQDLDQIPLHRSGNVFADNVAAEREWKAGPQRHSRGCGPTTDGMSQLIGSAIHILAQTGGAAVRTVNRLRTVMDLFMANKPESLAAIGSFASTLAALGRASSYQSGVN